MFHFAMGITGMPLAYSSETCAPTVEEINLLAAIASAVPDPLSNSL